MSLVLGGGAVTSPGEAAYLAGYDAAGNYLWHKTYGGSSAGMPIDQGNAVKIDAGGNLVFTGLKGTPWNVGGSWAFPNGLVVMSYTISGNSPPTSRWIKLPGAGSTGGSIGNAVALDSLGHVLSAGAIIYGSVNFGSTSATTASGTWSGFVSQFSN